MELWIADENDFSAIFEEFVDFRADNIAQDEPRRKCFNVFITDDDISEDTESFRVLMGLDPFVPQAGIEVNPAVTEICILSPSAEGNAPKRVILDTTLKEPEGNNPPTEPNHCMLRIIYHGPGTKA